jgi:hypothetical protein
MLDSAWSVVNQYSLEEMLEMKVYVDFVKQTLVIEDIPKLEPGDEVRLPISYEDEKRIMAGEGVRDQKLNDLSWVPVLYCERQMPVADLIPDLPKKPGVDTRPKLWVRFTSSGAYCIHAPVYTGGRVNLGELDIPDLD